MAESAQFWTDDIDVTYTDDKSWKAGVIRMQTADEVAAVFPAVPAGLTITVGTTYRPIGERAWVFIRADAAIAAGAAVVQNTGASDEWEGVTADGTAIEPAARVFGIAQFAIASGSYGFIGRRGVFFGLSDGSGGGAGIAARSALATTAAGAGNAGQLGLTGATEEGHFAMNKSVAGVVAGSYMEVDVNLSA